MKRGILIALAIGTIFGLFTGLASAHDRPPAPTPCLERCAETACACEDSCDKLDRSLKTGPCKTLCGKQKAECDVDCRERVRTAMLVRP